MPIFTCAACGAPIPALRSYMPQANGLLELRMVVDQDALREHLLHAHGPAPRPALRLTT